VLSQAVTGIALLFYLAMNNRIDFSILDWFSKGKKLLLGFPFVTLFEYVSLKS
jgi:hypothetical protein